MLNLGNRPRTDQSVNFGECLLLGVEPPFLIDVFSGGDFAEVWRSYRTKDSRSVDAICSLVWSNKDEVPQKLANLAGMPHARTYGKLAQGVRPIQREHPDGARHAYDPFDGPEKRCRDIGKSK